MQTGQIVVADKKEQAEQRVPGGISDGTTANELRLVNSVNGTFATGPISGSSGNEGGGGSRRFSFSR